MLTKLSDPSFKPCFQKDTCLFYMEFSRLMSTITSSKILRELDQGEDDIKDSMNAMRVYAAWINMQHGSFGLLNFYTRVLHL